MSLRRALGPRAKVAVRLLSAVARGRVRRVRLAEVTDEFAFSYGRDGWQPNVAIVRERRAHEGLQLADSEYFGFFTSPAVAAVADLHDVLTLHVPGKPAQARFWLGAYPWGGLSSGDHRRGGRPFGWAHDATLGTDTACLWGKDRTLWYQPASHATLRWEWEHTWALTGEIEANGYRLRRAGDLPTACRLVHSDGSERFVVVDGHHRLAVLAALEVPGALVRIVAVVRRRDARRWNAVRQGRCSVEEARNIFDAFFELDGHERLRAVLRDRTHTTLVGSGQE